MLDFLDQMTYENLTLFAILLGLAPFFPEPHLVEKTRMLLNRELRKPIDIFDLFMHLTPAVLLLLKFIKDL